MMFRDKELLRVVRSIEERVTELENAPEDHWLFEKKQIAALNGRIDLLLAHLGLEEHTVPEVAARNELRKVKK